MQLTPFVCTCPKSTLDSFISGLFQEQCCVWVDVLPASQLSTTQPSDAFYIFAMTYDVMSESVHMVAKQVGKGSITVQEIKQFQVSSNYEACMMAIAEQSA